MARIFDIDDHTLAFLGVFLVLCKICVVIIRKIDLELTSLNFQHTEEQNDNSKNTLW